MLVRKQLTLIKCGKCSRLYTSCLVSNVSFNMDKNLLLLPFVEMRRVKLRDPSDLQQVKTWNSKPDLSGSKASE